MNTTVKMRITRSQIEEEVPLRLGAAFALPGPLPPEVKDFLAMRARQREQQARARRQKRGVMALTAGAVVAGALIMAWSRPRTDRPDGKAPLARTAAPTAPAHPTSGAPRPAPAPAVAVALAAPAASPAVAQTPSPPPTLAAPPAPTAGASPVAALVPALPAASEPARVTASGAPITAPPVQVSADGPAVLCQASANARLWRGVLETCPQVFATAPSAWMALKIAHAHWAVNAPSEAGSWAAKAVELGTKDADAFVLIGHAQRRAGNREAAVEAYRTYLREAPRGWHAARIKAALAEMSPARPLAAAPAEIAPAVPPAP